MDTKILTHRGLDPDKKNYWPESSLEAFTDQLNRGFGLEFDIQFTNDLRILVTHNKDFQNMVNILGLKEMVALIINYQAENAVSAIHLKGLWQEKKYIDHLLETINILPRSKFIIFDTKPATAKYIKSKDKTIEIAPSVAHPYDIKRYSQIIGGTLIDINEVIKNIKYFDGVWLDEWDTKDENGGKKKLYTVENFKILRSVGLKIALVSPELHATSPGLLGGEKHGDALNKDVLTKRLKEIISLKPDIICTDHPDLVKNILTKQT